MQMKMILKGLIPGVQDGDDAKGSAKTASAKLQKRFTDGLEQKSQENFFIGQNQTVQFMGSSEDQVIVAHGQKLRGLLLQPPGFGQ